MKYEIVQINYFRVAACSSEQTRERIRGIFSSRDVAIINLQKIVETNEHPNIVFDVREIEDPKP